jgi:hypothetical protein
MILVVAAVLLAPAAGQGAEPVPQAAEARARLEAVFYARNLALAEREWLDRNGRRAGQLLDECPAALRGWEWHQLWRRWRARAAPGG